MIIFSVFRRRLRQEDSKFEASLGYTVGYSKISFVQFSTMTTRTPQILYGRSEM